MIVRFLLLVACLCLPGVSHARPVVFGGTPCTNSATDGDGCFNGGAIQVPTFFKGYAAQSVGANYPASSTYWGITWNPAVSHQPVKGVYPVRPPWNLCGIDYGCGMPRWQMPNLANLHPAWLKDPALVATDTSINPNADGANCKFYASNAAVPYGTPAGSTATPFPAPNGGPSIVCSNYLGSINQLIFDGYNFGWNGVTGYDCVPIYIYAAPWGSGADGTTPATAHVIIRNSLFVNGPNCNIWGGINQGAGTSVAGPQAAQSVYMVQLALGGNPPAINSFAFLNNTVYGCGGDPNASALETALCSHTFNATSYATGSVAGFVSGATVGVAPLNAHMMLDGQAGAGGNSWVKFNAFLHMPGHIIDYLNPNVGAAGYTQTWFGNYVEGMLYAPQPYAKFTQIVNTGGTQETITTASPHGVPVGGYFAMVLSGGGASGYPPGWNLTTTVQATDPTHLVFNNPANAGDWTWSGTGPQAVAYSNYGHGELTTQTGSINDVTYNGTISGSTLTINSAPIGGAIAIGQYVTANYGSGVAIPAGTYITAGSGNVWTLSQNLGAIGPANLANPLYTVGNGGAGGVITFNYSYNTFLQPSSVWGFGNTGTLEYTGGFTGLAGVPFGVVSGSIDHNVVVTNLTPGGAYRPMSVGSWALNSTNGYQGLTITNNYLDMTGALSCYSNLQNDSGTAIVMTNNVNLLNPSDPYINTLDGYAIVPYMAGTIPNTQAENGISYDAATGVVTITLAAPATFSAGQAFTVYGTVSAGANFLAGLHTATSVSGKTVTYNSGVIGATGFANSANPTLNLVSANGAAESCFGHN